MTPKLNYQILLEKQLDEISKQDIKPTLLLHACCAPCSSYVLEYLNEYFDITIYFYNPNISPKEEYDFRANELIRLINEMPIKNKVEIIIPEYDSLPFDTLAKGREADAERGNRCTECYKLRLKKTLEFAEKMHFDYFTTTLSISPYKDAERLNNIGLDISQNSKVTWLYSDFKKKNGYKRSIELSNQYNLYRQNYCGCVYSKPKET